MEQLIDALINTAIFAGTIAFAVLLGANPRRHFDRSITGKRRPYR